MTYIQTTPPAAEPLTLAEVKAHLRLSESEEDAYVSGLVAIARDHLERTTGIVPIRQSFRLVLDSLSEDGVIQILKGPVQTIDRVRIFDATGAAALLDAARIRFDRDSAPCSVQLAGAVDPARVANGLEVEFTAGFGAAGNEVPGSIRRALLLHVAAMFEFRGGVSLDDQPAVLPDGYDRLLAPFRMRRL